MQTIESFFVIAAVSGLFVAGCTTSPTSSASSATVGVDPDAGATTNGSVEVIVSGTAAEVLASFSQGSLASVCTYADAPIPGGKCQVYTCANSPQPAISDGPLTITDGDKVVDLSPQADGTYPAFLQETNLFAPGDQVAIAGSGAQAPAFESTLYFPAAVTVTQPAWSKNLEITLDRTQPISFTWSTATAPHQDLTEFFVSMGVSSSTGDFDSVGFNCYFPLSAGAGTVPASVLTQLPTGTGYVEIESRVESDQPSDVTDVWLINQTTCPEGLVTFK